MNHPEIWDADNTNDGSFSGKDNFPEGDILLAPYYKNGSTGESVCVCVSDQYCCYHHLRYRDGTTDVCVCV